MQQDFLNNFEKLATMRPKACASPAAPAIAAPGWRLQSGQCAWQGRLRTQRWVGPAENRAADCVSPSAQWWLSARRTYRDASVPSLAWHAAWTSQLITSDGGAEKRLAVIFRAPDGNWGASEWIWRPSDKPATRRWQESRWKLLLADATRFKQAVPQGAPATGVRAIEAVWEKNLGERPGEVGQGTWQWQAAGHCMSMDTVGVGQGKFRLPYLIEDSRLEQRAALQLQLARRYPEATWLVAFRPVPASDTAGAGGAKYEAIWQDRASVRGQLWIPTKSDGPVLRLRLSTARSPGAGTDAARAVERELAALAQTWAKTHE